MRPGSDLIIYEGDLAKITACLKKLHEESRAKAAFLIDKNGQLVANVGETGNMDTTALASLTAGNIAATGGLAQLLGEREFSVLFHEGEKDHLHISVVAERLILLVIFDQRSTLGLIRLRVKKASEEMVRIFQEIQRHAKGQEKKGGPFGSQWEITDDDIDNLFGRT